MANQEKFKTTIGGQALIEGILMRGPEKDAVVIRGKDGLTLENAPGGGTVVTVRLPIGE